MNEWKSNKEIAHDGDFVLVHGFCTLFAGYVYDTRKGVSYEEYLSSFVPEDEDDKPVCQEDYEYNRFIVEPVYSGQRPLFWEEIEEWMPLPEIDQIIREV